MNAKEWVMVIGIIAIIGVVFITALVKNKKNTAILNTYSVLCHNAGGSVVNTNYNGYRCYGSRLIIKGYENE